MPPAEGKDHFLALEGRFKLQFRMRLSGILQAVGSRREAKQKQGDLNNEQQSK